MRYLAALLFCLFSTTAWAQDTAAPSLGEKDAYYREAETLNAFGHSTGMIREVDNSAYNNAVDNVPAVAQNFPPCDDAKLLQKVREQLAMIMQNDVPSDIYNQRRRILILKNTNHFIPTAVDGFSPKENFTVAGRLTEIKVNEGLYNADLQLCRSDNPITNRRIYVLMYSIFGRNNAEILNFSASDDAKKYLHFTY